MIVNSLAATAALILLLSPALTSACVPQQRTTSTGSTNRTINFIPCADTYHLNTEFECANFTVPIDHDNPHNDQTLDLWIARRKANGTSGATAGSLFFNFGGPGGSASEPLQAIAAGAPLFSQRLLENFDLIAVDPRGIGYSSPITCDHAVWNARPKALATSDEGFAAIREWGRDFSNGCRERTGPAFDFLDTVSTVKDYELVRQALGDDKFNFLAFSYGTAQGQTYAELYPDRVGRQVWDGLVAHDVYDVSTVMTEGLAYESTLTRFFDWCDASADCPLHGKPVADYFARLANATSLPAPACNASGACASTVTGDDVLFNTQSKLVYVDLPPLSTWAGLAADIQTAVEGGDASAFSNPVQTEDTLVSGYAAYLAFGTWCQDWGSWVSSAGDVQRLLQVTSHLLPVTQGRCEASLALAYCSGWTAPVRYPAARLDQERISAISSLVMMVNSFWDPETSPVWAERTREQVKNAVNVWRDGAGHTSYILQGDVARAMDEFLISGTLPADGTVYTS